MLFWLDFVQVLWRKQTLPAFLWVNNNNNNNNNNTGWHIKKRTISFVAYSLVHILKISLTYLQYVSAKTVIKMLFNTSIFRCNNWSQPFPKLPLHDHSNPLNVNMFIYAIMNDVMRIFININSVAENIISLSSPDPVSASWATVYIMFTDCMVVHFFLRHSVVIGIVITDNVCGAVVMAETSREFIWFTWWT